MRRAARISKAAVANQESEAAHDPALGLPDDFCEKIRPRLYQRIGEELRGARRVLDLGCGGCELGRFLAETYRQKVIGVDITDGSFPDRHELESRTRNLLRCIKVDARRLDILAAGAIDAVVLVWALHKLKQPRAVLLEARRVLHVSGKLLIVDCLRGSLAKRLWDEDSYIPHQVSQLLAATGYVDVSAGLVGRRQVLWAKGFHAARKELMP